MRVVLDATAGARSDASGIARYVQELVRALSRECRDHHIDLGVRTAKWSGRSHLPSINGNGRRPRLIDDRLDWLLLRRVDLFHGLDARITPLRGPVRVATLHDLFSLERSDLASEAFRAKKQSNYRRIADEADAVICVSRSTRDAFVAAFPHARARTHVVHHGVSSRFRPASAEDVAALRARRGLERPFLLFVGRLATRKNVPVLLEAFARVARERDDLDLVLAGDASRGFATIAPTLERHPFPGRVRRLGFVPDEELPTLYSAAELLVFPSLSEGFGLPLLESISCGTPVVASDLPALREIGGADLIVADTKRDDLLAAALLQELGRPLDAGRRERLAAHAAGFTWEATARRTLEVWREALSRNGRGAIA